MSIAATVARGGVRGPSGSEQASGTNNTTGSATILRNDASKFQVSLNGIEMSVSDNVVKASRALGLRLEVGDVIGVALSADTNEVCRIFDNR